MIEWITNLDFSVLYFVQENLRCDFLDAVCAFLSVAFDAGIGWFIIAVVMAFPKKTRTSAAAVVCSVLITFLIGELMLKNTFCRVRPCGIDPSVSLAVDRPGSFSFPSGHTGASFAAAFSMFFFNKKLGIPAVILAVLIGFSRVYLFVHYPTDVLCGAILGTLMAFCVYKIFRHFSVETKLTGLRGNK